MIKCFFSVCLSRISLLSQEYDEEAEDARTNSITNLYQLCKDLGRIFRRH